ncbi:MAG: CopD family protein [Gemmatimonadetes bacterium]|nr:CopD family protein [Gemmatimonadota bacterium]
MIEWPEAVVEYVGFVAQFVATGAVGFRFAAVRDRLRATRNVGATGDGRFYAYACARAARLGLLAAIVSAILFANHLPDLATRAHTTVTGLVTHDRIAGAQTLLTIVGVLGLLVAAARASWGWPLAAIGIILGPLSGILSGQWLRLVNPVHRVVAGLWIGTLFVLVVAGLVPLLRDVTWRDRRGTIASDMVNGFSPLALTCGAFVVLSGLITAYRHLTPLSSLFTTPYGWALLVKLALVAIVFMLGAWNWRRQRPALGGEGAAIAIRRSSAKELAVAAVVLAVTAILVSLPSPRAPKPGGAPGAGGPPGAGGAPAGPPATSPPT